MGTESKTLIPSWSHFTQEINFYSTSSSNTLVLFCSLSLSAMVTCIQAVTCTRYGCFCCNLRTCSTVFASIDLVMTVLATFSSVILVLNHADFSPDYPQYSFDYPVFRRDDLFGGTLTLSSYFNIGKVVLTVIIDSLLLHGIRKQRPGLFLPFIIWTSINIIFYIISVVSELALGMLDWGFLVTMFVVAVFPITALACVYRYRRQILDSRKEIKSTTEIESKI